MEEVVQFVYPGEDQAVEPAESAPAVFRIRPQVDDEAPTPVRSNTTRTKKSRNKKPVKIKVKSFGAMQLFSADYFEEAAGGAKEDEEASPGLVGVKSSSSSSDSDEEDREEESEEEEEDDNSKKDSNNDLLEEEEDDAAALAAATSTALQDTEQLEQLLQDLQTRTPPSPERAGTFSPTKESPERGYSDFTPRLEPQPEEGTNDTAAAASHSSTMEVTTTVSADITESTAEVSETEEPSSSSPQQEQHVAEVVSAVTVETIESTPRANKNHEDDSDDDDDDDDNAPSDDDSLDLGVSTSVWPSQTNHHGDTVARISTLARGIFSPSDLLATKSFDEDGAESLEDEDDDDATLGEEKHEGADVFLATEGARYGKGANPGSPGRNDLFRVQEAESPTANGAAAQNPSLKMFVADDDDESSGGGDGLDFQPRYQENQGENDDDDKDMWEDLKVVTKDLSEEKEVGEKDRNGNDPAKSKEETSSCFGSIQFVSPKLFEEGESKAVQAPEAKSTPQRDSLMSPLSSMVHPMDLKLFVFTGMNADMDDSFSSVGSESVADDSIASCPVERSPCSVFLSDQHSISGTETKNRRSNLSSSFRSSTKSNRVAYRLGSGKKSMSPTDRIYSKSFLPSKPVLNPADLPSTRKRVTNDRSLSILLVEMSQKIFEIVSVDIFADTTVGDALAKARSVATDPALSEQKYVSICYGSQDFGAPMLPVSLLIDWNRHKTRPLAVAVPTGHSAAEMQAVKRVLSKNPRIQRWWRQQDPFHPRAKHVEVEETVHEGEEEHEMIRLEV